MDTDKYSPDASQPIPQASCPLIYANIPYFKRQQLIELVLENDLPIAMAARLAGINYSTAKSIIKVYKKEGHIFSRKCQNSQKAEFKKEFSQTRVKQQNISNNQGISENHLKQEVKENFSCERRTVIDSCKEQNNEKKVMEIPLISFNQQLTALPYPYYPFFTPWNYPFIMPQ